MRAASPANTIRKITDVAGFWDNRVGEWDGFKNCTDVGRVSEHWNMRNILLSRWWGWRTIGTLSVVRVGVKPNFRIVEWLRVFIPEASININENGGGIARPGVDNFVGTTAKKSELVGACKSLVITLGNTNKNLVANPVKVLDAIGFVEGVI